jgi:hypothetical protein
VGHERHVLIDCIEHGTHIIFFFGGQSNRSKPLTEAAMGLSYEESGRMPTSGILLATAAGLSTAVVLGIAYSYAIVYIPVVYVNALISMLFALLVGGAVASAAKAGHVRNALLVGIIGGVSGLVGLYVAWGTDLLARIGLPPNADIFTAFRPDVLVRYMQFFYEKGLWSISNFGRDKNAQMVSGLPLAAVWLLEAAVVVGGATFTAWTAVRRLVYCEHCERWVKSEKGVKKFAINVPQNLISLIVGGDVGKLDALPLASPGDRSFLRLDLDCCDGCSTSNYLSIERIVTSLDKKGKPKQESTTLVRHLAVKPADALLIRQAGPLVGDIKSVRAVPPPLPPS